MKIRWPAVLSALVLGLAVGGCGGKGQSNGKDAVIARVGERTVTKSYYENRLEKMERAFLPDTLDLAGKREFLGFIVNKELMALKAEQLGYANEPQITSNIDLIEMNLVHSKAVDLVVAGKDSVSAAEVQDFYEKQKNPVMAKHILVRTRREIDQVAEELRGGADFDALVEKYSIVPRTDPDGNMIPNARRAIFGQVEFGQAQPWVEDALFSTPLNQATEPLQTAYGWHLFMPVATETKRLLPLAEQHDRIQQQIMMRKRRKLVNDYYDSILAEHGYKPEETTLDFVFDKLPPDLPPDRAPDPATEVKPVIAFSVAERTRMMFMLDGKKYTVGDFSDTYDATSWFERPKRVNGMMGVQFWIRDTWMKPLQVERARKNGVDKHPDIVNEVAMRREQMMVNFLHYTLIANQIPAPTEVEIQAFYEKHKNVYVSPEMRSCNVIYHQREQVVRRAYDEIKGGADFVETAVLYNETATEPQHVLTPAFTRTDEGFAEIAPIAFSLERKAYSEPFKTSQGWVVIQLQEVIRETPLLLADIRESVIRDIGNEWSEKKLNELLEEWKKEFPVQIDEAVLTSAEVRRDDVYVPGRPAPTTPADGGAGTSTKTE